MPRTNAPPAALRGRTPAARAAGRRADARRAEVRALLVTIPAGASPGQRLQFIDSASGTFCHRRPLGCTPGQQLRVMVPVPRPPPPPPAGPAPPPPPRRRPPRRRPRSRPPAADPAARCVARRWLAPAAEGAAPPCPAAGARRPARRAATVGRPPPGGAGAARRLGGGPPPTGRCEERFEPPALWLPRSAGSRRSPLRAGDGAVAAACVRSASDVRAAGVCSAARLPPGAMCTGSPSPDDVRRRAPRLIERMSADGGAAA